MSICYIYSIITITALHLFLVQFREELKSLCTLYVNDTIKALGVSVYFQWNCTLRNLSGIERKVRNVLLNLNYEIKYVHFYNERKSDL